MGSATLEETIESSCKRPRPVNCRCTRVEVSHVNLLLNDQANNPTNTATQPMEGFSDASPLGTLVSCAGEVRLEPLGPGNEVLPPVILRGDT